MVARFLSARGLRIVAQNLRVGRGELDLVAVDGSERVAVEVRTRKGVDPFGAFSEAKADLVWEAARNATPSITRVDIAFVKVAASGVEVRWLPRVS